MRRRLFKSIAPQFVYNELNNGPFTLVCDDFRPGNMLVRDGKIVAVFDWEWTYAGPLELLLSPPRWLYKDWPAVWDADQRAGYGAKFEKFVEILEEEEMKIVKSGCPIMSKLMKESWNRSGKFEYYQLLGEVFLFDEDWLWERIEVDYASHLQDSLDDTSIVERKWTDYLGYLTMSGPMRVFDYLRGLKGSARCSFCWACLHPDWMGHDISDCVQLPYDNSTVSVTEAVATCRSHFRYPEGLDIHLTCGAPYYFGCTDKHCLYQMIVYSVYVAATGKASHLHHKARIAFSKRYDIDIDKFSPEELMAVMARPHQVGSRTVSALVWFIKLIHDNAEASFQWYSQHGL